MQPRTARESLRQLKHTESASWTGLDGQDLASDGLKAQAQLSSDVVSLQIMQDWVMGSNVGPVASVVVVVAASVVVTGGGACVVILRLQSGSLQDSQLLPIHPSGKSDKHPRFT